MQYYTAPMEGLTDRIWRQAHQRWFGAPGAPARYYAPFLSPPENRVLIKKKMAELDPAANPGTPVIPQLLAKDGALAAWMVTELRRLGYTEVNLNFGCPSGTVTAKGKGAGMLRDPAKLEAFLDEFFSRTEGPVSVKTRLGVTRPEEFDAILDIYNRYPICELTIHPRVMRQLYRGEADRAAAGCPSATTATSPPRPSWPRWRQSIRPSPASWWAGASSPTRPCCGRPWAVPLPAKKSFAATSTSCITATPRCSARPAAPSAG